MAADTDTTEALAVLLASEHLDVLERVEEMGDIETELIAQAALTVIASHRRGRAHHREQLRAVQRAAWRILA